MSAAAATHGSPSRGAAWPSLRALACLALAAIAGCATVPPTQVHQPMSARPLLVPEQRATAGAIYQSGYNDRPLFEDVRARHVGDTLVVIVSEKTSASKKASSTAKRTSSVSASAPTIRGVPGKTFQGLGVDASSDSSFDGGGDSSANNDFTGTITVTVIEVLTNGNLLVSGEKQLGINQGNEFVRLSGVVSPATIVPGNQVLSSQVADARIEYRSSGYIDEAQVMGWLGRFFLTFLPF